MYYQVSIAANRTGEVQVICLGQPVMAQRLRRVTGAFQAFEQCYLERLLLRFSAKRGYQSLELSAMSQIADSVIEAEHELAILRQFFRVWIFMDSIDSWDSAFL